MADTPLVSIPENKNVNNDAHAKWLINTYGDTEEGKADAAYATEEIQRINRELERRERPSLITNGVSYSLNYWYNLQKAINYAPPMNKEDDREISSGIVHEKIIFLASLFLKYKWRRNIKCYAHNGDPIEDLGDFYNLGIEFSSRIERLDKKLFLILFELFSQGDAFVIEEWQVLNKKKTKILIDGKEVAPEDMDYSYEALENATFVDGDEVQERHAVSRLMDGRQIIFSNPEINDLQEMPQITIEMEVDRSYAEQLFGTLKRWKAVPQDRTSLDTITPQRLTLFDNNRLSKPSERTIIHIRSDKRNNRYNTYVNGVMMLSRKTPFTAFYPDNNYPISHFCSERVPGSIYSRSVPAKVKFNADYADWVLKKLALKFEQGIEPALLAKGKYTLSRKIFRGGQITHGVKKEDYEKADPDNKGITTADMSMYDTVKDIMETQTANAVAAGEIQQGATATEIAITDQNQRDKLAALIDGICCGWIDWSLRRAETLRFKYVTPKDKTLVNGKEINIYNDFHIEMDGTTHHITFDERLGDPFLSEDKIAQMKSDLHKQKFQDAKEGKSSNYINADPKRVRKNDYFMLVEIIPERIKELSIQIQELIAELTAYRNLFPTSLNESEMQKIVIQKTGRPAALFNPPELNKLQTPPTDPTQQTPPGAPPPQTVPNVPPPPQPQPRKYPSPASAVAKANQ